MSETPIDPAYVEYCEKRIADLECQVAALTKERDEALNGYAIRDDEVTGFVGMLKESREQLAAAQEQITALTNDRNNYRTGYYDQNEICAQFQRELNACEDKLAAAQAVNEKLRGALQLERESERRIGVFKSTVVALATPNDTTALQARLAEEREKMAEYVDRNLMSCREYADAIRSIK